MQVADHDTYAKITKLWKLLDMSTKVCINCNTTFRVENGWKYFCSDPFRFLFLSVRFRICGIPFSYLRK